ncbi:MAG: hypothetical protein RL164_1424 [Bacteroidota bacterium]
MLRRLFNMEIAENRVFGLDILRFIAIFMVLLGHSLILAPQSVKKVVNPFLYDGVAIFFVLSGFLIGGILLKVLNKGAASWAGLIDFWKRRWMRTLPVYLFVLLYLLIYTGLVLPKKFPSEWYRFFFFIQNIFGHHRPGFFAEAWSLSIEEWFYLSVPLLIFGALIIFKTGTKNTILAVCLLIIGLVTWYRYHLYYQYGFPNHPNPLQIKQFQDFLNKEIEYQVIPRLDSIMYGVLAAYIAFYYPKWWSQKWNFVLLILGVFLLFYTKFHMGKTYGPFNNIWSPSLKSLAVFFMLPFMANLKKGFGKWTIWVTFFSLISYSMYLINLNVVIITIIKQTIHGNYSSKKFIPSDTWYLDYGLFWLLTIAISFVLYQLIEVPFMKLRDKKKA